MEDIASFNHKVKNCSYLLEIENYHFLSEFGNEAVIAAQCKQHLVTGIASSP